VTLSASSAREIQATGSKAAPAPVDRELGLSGEPQETIERIVRPMPDRYRNALGKYKINRSADCVACGECAKACPHGVHVKPDGYTFSLRPRDHLCVGPSCAETDHFCVAKCKTKALSMARNPTVDTMGDPRWTADLILSTWHMAETGHAPEAGLEYRTGESGGGFDRIGFNFPAAPAKVDPAKVDTGLDLNHRNDGRPQVHIDLPVYGGGMSFGSVSIHTILAKARTAAAWNIFTCTGEGGYHDRLKPYDDHVITQVATGLVRRPRRHHSARAHRRVQVRPGRQARPRRPPARRQEHAGRRAHARSRAGQRLCSRRSHFTACTASRITRSTSTGSRKSTRALWSR
jgi:ferredoxin